MSEMNDIIKVGNRVRRPHWDPDAWAEVRFIDDDMFYGRTEEGDPGAWGVASDEWELFPEPVVYPERWINVTRVGVGGRAWNSREQADREPRYSPRIGVIHLHPDGTLEMEAP